MTNLTIEQQKEILDLITIIPSSFEVKDFSTGKSVVVGNTPVLRVYVGGEVCKVFRVPEDTVDMILSENGEK